MHPIEKILQYQFKDSALLTLALTHPSAGTAHYQRLEFLGDRVLGLMIANWLMRDHQLSEGTMAKWLAEITSKNHLARIGEHLKIRAHITTHLPQSHEKKCTKNLLSDVIESLIGAVFLDSDFPTASNIFLGSITNPDLWKKGERHAKNELQEWTQKHSHTLPIYTVLKESPQGFRVQCMIDNLPPTTGQASQKRTAEIQAASRMLKQIGE